VKQNQHTTLAGTRTTTTDVCRWVQSLFGLHARIAARFARAEPRRRVLAYLQGILSDISRKNGWHLAEHAREARPDGMQRLLSQAVWDTNGVRDDLRAYALEQLGMESAILVIDETSFPKRGHQSAGVAMQYCGTSGHVENCQVGVFLSYVTARGHTLIDRELYLPLEWCEHHQYAYVLAVTCNEPVGIMTADGQRRRVEVRDVEALLLAEQEPRCKTWSKPLAHAGISRKILKTPKIWVWTTTRWCDVKVVQVIVPYDIAVIDGTCCSTSSILEQQSGEVTIREKPADNDPQPYGCQWNREATLVSASIKADRGLG